MLTRASPRADSAGASLAIPSLSPKPSSGLRNGIGTTIHSALAGSSTDGLEQPSCSSSALAGSSPGAPVVPGSGCNSGPGSSTSTGAGASGSAACTRGPQPSEAAANSVVPSQRTARILGTGDNGFRGLEARDGNGSPFRTGSGPVNRGRRALPPPRGASWQHACLGPGGLL